QFREYPELLRSPRFWGYTMAAALSSGAFFAYLGGAPFVGTEVFGLSAAQLGFYFGAPAVGYFVGNFLTGRYSVRFGINRMVLWGCVAICVGLVLNIAILWAGLGSAPSFFGLMTLVGLGNGLALPSAASGAMSVRPHIAGTASGLSGAIMLAGGAALSALAGSVLTPGSGALLLLYIMLATGLLAVLSIYVVIWRARQLGLER
ncbi:MAG: MFS transporter, partial [Sedimentitalea sp.]|nr:MFS transporter [Sedimentitalea sp.]